MRMLATLCCALFATAALCQPGHSSSAGDFEGAVGLIVHHSPNYLGAGSSQTKLVPGLFMRYGRFSVTTTGGFVTRRNDEVERGVSAELFQRQGLRVSLAGRFDGGRDAGSDKALAGLPDLRATLRARLSVVQRLGEGWRISAALSPDVLGRGGGITADAGVAYEWRLAPRVSANLGLTGTWADKTYHQNYFGITPAQSRSSGHVIYQPTAGLRDLGVQSGIRIDLGPNWIGYVSAGATALQGPALDSPLTQRRFSWRADGGLAWRF